MREEGVQLYLITKTDFHMSEIPSEYFNAVEFISGFSGSNGTLIVTEKHVHLWTDGRYTLQANQELAGTGISIHISTNYEDEIRTVPMFFSASGEAFFDAIVDDGIKNTKFSPEKFKTTIGCDGRTIPFELTEEIIDNLGIAFDSGAVSINAKLDLVGDIWKDRPELPLDKVWVLDEKYAGESVQSKLERLRDNIESYSEGAGAVFTSLDDIAWLYNIRGNDIKYSLTALSYAYVNQENAYIFIDSRKLTGKVREHLESAGVTIKAYDEFYGFLDEVDDRFVIVDPSRNNSAVIVTLGDRSDIAMVNHYGLIGDLKAIKNDAERENALEVHLVDAAVMIRFIKWVKDNVGKINMTEMSAASYVNLLREQAGAISPSFETICAYGANSAIVHYTASEESNAEVRPEGFLLIDSGGHYYGGTTDVTRTIPLGELTDEMKRDYTIALKGFLQLLNARFLREVTDYQLDMIARAPIWKYGMEYNHGTGHGVGNMLNVHEGPQSISWYKSGDPVRMRAGMITSCEPGLYVEGKYGIRHENLTVCVADMDHPGYLKFVSLTYVPIDTSAVDKKYLDSEEVEMLNDYNRKVYEITESLLDDEHREWLSEITAPI